MPKRCLTCGSSRNYISKKGNKWVCSLCGNEWDIIGPIAKKLLGLEEERKRVESQIQSERLKTLRRKGIEYHRSRVES